MAKQEKKLCSNCKHASSIGEWKKNWKHDLKHRMIQCGFPIPDLPMWARAGGITINREYYSNRQEVKCKTWTPKK